MDDQCVAVMIDINALKNVMCETLERRIGLKVVEMEDLISCQILNGDVGLITKKVSRVGLSLTNIGRNFFCKEEIMVLEITHIELILSIEFLR